MTIKAQTKYSFLDDYSEGAHPQLLEALIASNDFQVPSYGKDPHSEEARRQIQRHLGSDDVGIFFVPNGTSANAISIATCLRPHEAVIAANTGHIVTREAGAIEGRGHKIIHVPPKAGKLTPESISRALEDNWHYPHMAKPGMVYISNATELGTAYTKSELTAIKRTCEKADLLLFVDGARIGPALVSEKSNMTWSDMLKLTDIFWIAGTKNGALLGEAIIVKGKDSRLSRDFEFYIKQQGCLLAKGRIMGAQFAELFREDLYFELARQANSASKQLSQAIAHAGFSLVAETETNQVFASLPLALVERLQKDFIFYLWEKESADRVVVRLLTTWATDQAQIEKFCGILMGWKGE